MTAFTAYGTDGLQTASIAPATTGPIIHASVSTVASSELALTSSSSGTRFGIAAFAAGRKNPVAMPATAASADDRGRALDERQRREHAEADEVGADHEPAPRQPVDERAEQKPDDDDREEVGDEERRDPDARVRHVVDLRRRARSPRGTCRSSTPRSRGRGTRTTETGEGGRDGWCSPPLVTLAPVLDSDYGCSGRVHQGHARTVLAARCAPPSGPHDRDRSATLVAAHGSYARFWRSQRSASATSIPFRSA